MDQTTVCSVCLCVWWVEKKSKNIFWHFQWNSEWNRKWKECWKRDQCRKCNLSLSFSFSSLSLFLSHSLARADNSTKNIKIRLIVSPEIEMGSWGRHKIHQLPTAFFSPHLCLCFCKATMQLLSSLSSDSGRPWNCFKTCSEQRFQSLRLPKNCRFSLSPSLSLFLLLFSSNRLFS